MEMRAREKALEATEAAAAAAAEKRQAEVEMNLSASERLAALHQTYIAKIAAPSANAADAVASGASTPRGGGGPAGPHSHSLGACRSLPRSFLSFPPETEQLVVGAACRSLLWRFLSFPHSEQLDIPSVGSACRSPTPRSSS